MFHFLSAQNQSLGGHHGHIVVASVELQIRLCGSGVGAEHLFRVPAENVAGFRGEFVIVFGIESGSRVGKKDIEQSTVALLSDLGGKGFSAGEEATDHPVGQHNILLISSIKRRGDPEDFTPWRIKLRNGAGTIRIDIFADRFPSLLKEKFPAKRNLF